MNKRIQFRETVSNHFSLARFLKRDDYWSEIGSNHIFCPFHRDEEDRSATYYPDDDLLWCYRDKRQYSSYDYLRQIEGLTDEEIRNKLPEDVTFETNSKTDKSIDKDLKEELNDIKYKFSLKNISIDEAANRVVNILS